MAQTLMAAMRPLSGYVARAALFSLLLVLVAARGASLVVDERQLVEDGSCVAAHTAANCSTSHCLQCAFVNTALALVAVRLLAVVPGGT